MHWDDRNFVRASEMGGLLLVDNRFGGPYWEISCWEFLVCATLEEVWYMKGYLLNVSAMRRYSLLLNVKKLVARSCQRILGMSLGSMGWRAYMALCRSCIS